MTEKKTNKKPTAQKKATTKVEEMAPLPTFEANKTYKIEATSPNPHLKSGQTYEVTGELAEILVKKGVAKLV